MPISSRRSTMDSALKSCHIAQEDTLEIMEKVEGCIRNKSLYLATQITRLNRQAVAKRLFYDDCGKQKYMIIFGIPEKSDRHGIGEEGFLYEPVKTALIDAIENDEIVIVQDASSDERTQYMRMHIINKNILSLAIVPIRYADEVKYLIILDKVPPSGKGFTDQEIKFLKDQKKVIETRDIPCSKAGVNIDLVNIIIQMLNSLLHETLNRLQPIGGFARRIKKKLPSGHDNLQTYADTIIKDALLCEHNFKIFQNLVMQLLPTDEMEKKIPVSDILERFNDEHYEFPHLSVNGLRKQKIIAVPSRIDSFFMNLKNYLNIRTNNGNGVKTLVQAEKEGSFLRINMVNESFRSVSAVLELFEFLAASMNGWLKFQDDCCVIALPMYEK